MRGRVGHWLAEEDSWRELKVLVWPGRGAEGWVRRASTTGGSGRILIEASRAMEATELVDDSV